MTNIKRLLVEYFEALINRVDIHTEEQLEKFSSTDTTDIPYKETFTITTKKDINVHSYLNATRDGMIKKLNEAQIEALKHLEMVKNEIVLDDKTTGNDDPSSTKKDEMALGKLLAKRFPIIIQIDDFGNDYLNKIQGPFVSVRVGFLY